MSNYFQIVQSGSRKDAHLIDSMHKLRYEIFHNELKWSTGLRIIENREFDEYDKPGTTYIVRVNNDNEVDASCRLIPTDSPYMIADYYSHFITKMPIPKEKNIWEISRFCASKEARIATQGKITGQIIASAIEYGIVMDIKNYVALATDTVLPVIKRIAGWDPTPLGERMKTPDDHSYSVLYTVNRSMLQKIQTKNNISDYLLFDLDEKVAA